jgi:hypothetical protein
MSRCFFCGGPVPAERHMVDNSGTPFVAVPFGDGSDVCDKPQCQELKVTQADAIRDFRITSAMEEQVYDR